MTIDQADSDTRTDAQLIERWPDEYERYQDEAMEPGSGVRDAKAWAIGKLRKKHPMGATAAAPARKILKAWCDACGENAYIDSMTPRDGFALCPRCYRVVGPVTRDELPGPHTGSAKLLAKYMESIGVAPASGPSYADLPKITVCERLLKRGTICVRPEGHEDHVEDHDDTGRDWRRAS